MASSSHIKKEITEKHNIAPYTQCYPNQQKGTSLCCKRNAQQLQLFQDERLGTKLDYSVTTCTYAQNIFEHHFSIHILEVKYNMEKANSLKGNGITPAASIAATKVFFLGVLGMSILISVRANLLKFIWHLTMSGASTRA
jgi:hypothetical protein